MYGLMSVFALTVALGRHGVGGEDGEQKSDEGLGVHGNKDITAPGWKE